MIEPRNQGGTSVYPLEEWTATASAVLAERFPAVLSDLGGKAEWLHNHLVSTAEGINEDAGRRDLESPDTVAASFVLGVVRRDWRLVGRAEPGDESEQRAIFARLAFELARHMRTALRRPCQQPSRGAGLGYRPAFCELGR